MLPKVHHFHPQACSWAAKTAKLEGFQSTPHSQMVWRTNWWYMDHKPQVKDVVHMKKWRLFWRTDLCKEMDLLQTAILELKGVQRYTNISYTSMHSNLSTHIFIASCDPLLVWNMLSTFQCATLMSQSYESTRVCVPQMTCKIGEFGIKTAWFTWKLRGLLSGPRSQILSLHLIAQIRRVRIDVARSPWRQTARENRSENELRIPNENSSNKNQHPFDTLIWNLSSYDNW